jgi:hypothetical protein
MVKEASDDAFADWMGEIVTQMAEVPHGAGAGDDELREGHGEVTVPVERKQVIEQQPSDTRIDIDGTEGMSACRRLLLARSDKESKF